MIMPMMGVREMVVRMRCRFMPVSMSMSSARRNGWVKLVVVVRFYVNMFVIVFQRVMNMFVLVPLAQVQPYADRH